MAVAQPRSPRIATPLVVVTTLIVVALSITMLVLDPQQLGKWILAIIFLPLALGTTMYFARRRGAGGTSPRYFGQIRAALVGAGVLLATALGFAVTDTLGWTGEDGHLEGRGLLMFLPAIVAVVIELAGMALEKAAAKDPDDEQDGNDNSER